jgi:hypothetical protein
MTIALVLDLVIAVLLAAAVGFCLVLNRKLTGLRAAQAELSKTIAAFDRAAAQAQAGLNAFRASESQAADLARTIAEGRALAEDLAFVVETGGRLADRLTGLRDRRNPVAPRSETEHELAQTLRGAK